MRHKGKITTWNDDRGFGFIVPFDGGKKVFVHIKAFKNRSRRPDVDEVVTYSITTDSQGRLQAANATLAGDKLPKMSAQAPSRGAIYFACVFLATVGMSVFAADLPLIILVAYLIVSMITFIAYAIDKSAAQAGRWRTPESTLQLLGLAGGWPGAMIAQQTLRHKSKKSSFRAVFWVTVLLNCAGLVWLHTMEGRNLIEQLLG